MLPNDHLSGDGVEAAAGEWLARRDRGFTPAEQDAFLQWLREPAHRTAFVRMERTWSALDSLAAWQPADGTAPNPELLAGSPPPRRHRGAALGLGVGLGLAAIFTVIVWRKNPVPAPGGAATDVPIVRVIPPPQSRTLVDGSVAEPNHGTRLNVAFTAQERRVQLEAGEVHLSVVKEPARPFVVEAGAVRVRAVGTAFDVKCLPDLVEVLVTEGTVAVESLDVPSVSVTRGQRARIEAHRQPTISSLEPDAIARELAWRNERLQFAGSPLRAVVAEFNRRNSFQLVIGDGLAGEVKVAGMFRSDEPQAFARMLEAGFGIQVDRGAPRAWILYGAPGK